MDTSRVLENLVDSFKANADAENAVPMAAYMKNRFDFLGIKSPMRRKLQQPFFKEMKSTGITEVIAVIDELWTLPYREFQYCASELLEKHTRRLPEGYIEKFQKLITTKSWWDSLDAIVPRSLGAFFKMYPHLIKDKVSQWVESENIWLNRAAILFQLKYKETTDKALLFDTVLKLKDRGEFFVDKAIGWALREYSKTNPEEIITFVETNTLSPLSKREALKIINQSTNR